MTRKAQQYTQEAVEKRVMRDYNKKASTDTKNARAALFLDVCRFLRVVYSSAVSNSRRRALLREYNIRINYIKSLRRSSAWRKLP